MSGPETTAKVSPQAESAARRAPWWGRFETDATGAQQRLAVRWPRILAVTGTVLLAGYLSLTAALWGYYSLYRKIPGVNWADIVILPRFSHVQTAIGDYYFATAKQMWEKKTYVQAIFTARAAVMKDPRNLEARLFLADAWRQAGRVNESIHTLRDGIAFDAGDPRLQRAAAATCLATGRYADLLKLLRDDLPAKGVHLLDGPDRTYQLAEVRAVLETTDAATAERVIAGHQGLADTPAAVPLLARIDWELGRHDAAYARLRTAREQTPDDPSVQDAFVETAIRMGDLDEARTASAEYATRYPDSPDAQLRFLEARTARIGSDREPWLGVCKRYLVEFHGNPAALQRLASLAARQGWSDLTFLLYQNSLQDQLSGFPFAAYYVGSLIKSGYLADADAAWRDLSLRNGAQLVSMSYFGAMIAWQSGRESEALQMTDQLRRETEGDLARRKSLEATFRDYGFPAIAAALEGQQS